MFYRRVLLGGRTATRLRDAMRLNVRRAYSSSQESETKARSWPWLVGLGGLVGTGVWWAGAPEGVDSGVQVSDYLRRTWHRMAGMWRKLEEPLFDKLLPDPLVDPQHPRPYTLVVDLDHFLVSHRWDREQARWRIAKRPGADLFLFYASQFYEVVVFSALPQHEGEAIVRKLDPYGCISHSLFRFATKHENGLYVKDTGRLNRDPAKLIVLASGQDGLVRGNGEVVPVKAWDGTDEADRTLEESIDFLEMLAYSGVKDVRPLLAQHAQPLFPESFEQKQRQVFEQTRQIQWETQQKRASNPLFRLFSLLGFSNLRTSNASDKNIATYEQKKGERMEARRREWNRIRDLMEKQLAVERQKEKEYYDEHKMSLVDLFARGPPTTPPPPSSGISA